MLRLRKTILISLIMVFVVSSVSAEVYTTNHTEGLGSCVYVAGDPDFYPIEYYNSKTKQYEGVIPELLEQISSETGIDFVYINGDATNRAELAENLQVEIVSSYRTDSNKSFAADYAELFSYTGDGKTECIGFGFTSIADQTTVRKIKAAAEKIPEAEINGLLLKSGGSNTDMNRILLFAMILCAALFVTMLLMVAIYIRNMKLRSKKDKMSDLETGMGNLVYFKHHFENTIDDFSRSLYYVAYIILDSSYLRSYHGGTTFEEVLKYAANVISEHMYDNEFAARITENGFALAFQSVNDSDAKIRIEEIISKLNDFADVKERNNKVVFHSAVYNLASSDRNCEIILFNLRKNCNKIFGSDQQVVFCDTHTMNKVQEEKKITESIINGLEKNEFKLYLQFIVDNRTKNIVSAEALSRWENPDQGLLGPPRYIDAMESSGLITRLDFYMFEMVCKQLERWNDTRFGEIALSCNFTRITISEVNFVERLKSISDQYKFDRSKLVVEITEDAIEKNRQIAMNNVGRCKELGFRIALDDLGSGYTSLSNLCDYPIDIVKVDRDILLKTDKKRGRDLFEGIIALSHSLNLKVVCEGVETKEQNELVSMSQCDFIQGWYYSKPTPVEECENFILQYS